MGSHINMGHIKAKSVVSNQNIEDFLSFFRADVAPSSSSKDEFGRLRLSGHD